MLFERGLVGYRIARRVKRGGKIEGGFLAYIGHHAQAATFLRVVGSFWKTTWTPMWRSLLWRRLARKTGRWRAYVTG